MQWKGDVVASPRRGGAAGTQGAALSFASEHPAGFRGACEGNRKKKRQQNNPKSAGCGWGRKEAAACGAGDPTFLSGGSAEASGGPEERKGRGAGGKGPLAPPRPLASRGGRWCGGGMAGGGGRPCSPPRGLLGMAAVVVVAAAAAGWGGLVGASAVPEDELRSVGLIQNNYIYADIKREVNVYVKVFTNSPLLVCMDLSLSQEEIIDPKYLWIGPDGKNLEGQTYANLTETGKLMLMGFKESMSGAYTCTLSHRIIETMTQEEVDVFETYKFMLYAYREADHAYQISVRFTTKGCELAANAQFFEELKKILDNLISDLTCHIIESSYKCHSIK
uniref:Zona-pellucida-binding protein 1/2 N-terminal domain-containing protein n=1 Tax=Anas platyrhynchos platyrhynchos TaxID=8840 RepID=U3J637_ANAPP